MPEKLGAKLLKKVREHRSLSQRDLAKKARTAQSVVARIELGDTSPTMSTLTRLVRAAGFQLVADVEPVPRLDPSVLDDIPRILRMSPEERLREVAQVSRFINAARRV